MKNINDLEAQQAVIHGDPVTGSADRARAPGRSSTPAAAPHQTALEGPPPFQPQAARGPRAAAGRLKLRRDRKTTNAQLSRLSGLIKARTRKKRS